MYSIKGSWVGQSFALATATCSDSAGRKSRVRRSKEERKSMVETFIKRYQSSNKGNFPSLNLTHKEVGGSFYTVREIVREIIQENRVLGPAQYSPELQHDDNVAAQYSLGSIAVEAQPPFCHLEIVENEVSNYQEKRIMELPLDNKQLYINHHGMESFNYAAEDETDNIVEDLADHVCSKSASNHVEECGSSEVSLNFRKQCLDENESIIDGVLHDSQINGTFVETDERQATGPLLPRNLETDEELVLMEDRKSQVRLPTEEVVVETFPLRPQNNGTDDSARLSTDYENSNGTWNALEVKPVDLTYDGPCMDRINSSVNSTDHVTTKGTFNIDSSHIQMNGEVAQHTGFNTINKEYDLIESSAIKEDTLVLHDHIDQVSSPCAVTSKTAEQLHNQCKNVPTETTCLKDRSDESNDKEPPFLTTSGNNRRDDKAVTASSQPVDRINLKSWQSAALKHQPNPVLALFKAFADALVKFWS